MTAITDFFDSVGGVIEGLGDDLGDLLDFGLGVADERDILDDRVDDFRERVNPEVDLTELERANPTNLNFPNPLGLSTPVLVISGLALTLLALKAFKVI